MNTLRHSKTWLSFVLILTVLTHFGFGHQEVSPFVLCFGADGHVAVERVAQAQHDTAKVSLKSKANTYFADSGSPCLSPCADIPLDGDAHTPLPLDVSKIAFDIGFLPLFFLISLVLYYPKLITRQPPFFTSLFTDSRLLALRSTVLLI
ncbi:hypothetical protein KFZ76_22435 [Methylovulum psychrotolerans]|jgi:hypothetical protein|uniref:hypothetical protein n=1 Tax=Methylovulum psychrotolerans TaxID=1704499 RepID=UPI001BFF1C6C|nr:hypothetical protein [Methylovulum psychrotolerans]MBT9100460.1 hypothetical protein [Methylovulum psychrotolerans]